MHPTLSTARRRRLLVLSLILSASLGLRSASAQAPAAPPQSAPTTLVEPPAPLLPERLGLLAAGSHAAGAASSLTDANFNPATCAALTEPASADGPGRCLPVLAEDGLLRAASTTYTAGPRHLELSAEQFADATGAFSAYTYLRLLMEGSPAASIGRRAVEPVPIPIAGANAASTDHQQTLIWAGTSVLALRGEGVTRAEIAAAVAGLPKISGRRGLAPLLPTFLPAEEGGARLDPASVRYAVGPIGYQAMNGVLPAALLNWDKSAEAATAVYTSRAGRGTLTLLLYPTPQIAGDRGRAIEAEINRQGTAVFGTVKLRRVGPLLGLATGALPAEQAQALVSALHLSEEITFDKPMPLEFHAEVHKTATLLESIALFVGVGTIAAIVLAVFLGGARAGFRVLRGKSAASDPEFLTINLHDAPKTPHLSDPPADPNDPADRTRLS